MWADLSSANAVTMRRVYGAGFDQPLARVSAAGVTGWYLTDRQGSVRQVLDNSGTSIGSRDYSAFGAITATSGTGLDRYGYTAREWDSTLGLQYTRMRMYDPATGRFTREDQLGLSAGDANLHRYVGNAATMGSDPSGLKNTDVFGYTDVWGYNNPGTRLDGFGRIISGFEIAGVGSATPLAPFAAFYGIDMAYHGALDLFTGEYHPTFTTQLIDAMTGTNCASKYEEVFNDVYSATRGVQSVPSLLRGARNFGRGAWSTSGWLTGRGASRLGFRDGLYGFNRFGEGFNSALQNWLKACFVAGTPICTPSGSKPIEEILVGDEVLSRDEFDPAGGVRAKRVLQTFVRVSPVLNLHVRGRVIGTTGEHPFYVDGRGWVAAHGLRIGDTLVSHDGQRVAVEGIADSGRIETVYNFEVADDHTYFVGGPEWGFSVWAHNVVYPGQAGIHSLEPGVAALVRELELLGVKVLVSEIKISGKGLTGKDLFTDLDIVTDIGVIQLKSGGGKGFAKQMAATKAVVDGLPVAAFDANKLAGLSGSVKGSVVKQLEREGHFFTSDVAALISYFRSAK